MRFAFGKWISSQSRRTPLVGRKTRSGVRLFLEPLEDRWVPTAFLVTDTSDSASDPNSLRFAIANLSAGGNTIDFAIAAPGSHQTIDLTSALPQITQQVNIQGFSQGGDGYSGPPLIVLNGASAGAGVNGLDFEAGSDGSEVQGLVVQQFGGSGIFVQSSNNLIDGNFIGTDKRGRRLPCSISAMAWISKAVATGDTVGGTTEGAGNVISGNGLSGVLISGSGASSNVVLGNLIGTDLTGRYGISNGGAGVAIRVAAAGNTVERLPGCRLRQRHFCSTAWMASTFPVRVQRRQRGVGQPDRHQYFRQLPSWATGL